VREREREHGGGSGSAQTLSSADPQWVRGGRKGESMFGVNADNSEE